MLYQTPATATVWTSVAKPNTWDRFAVILFATSKSPSITEFPKALLLL